VAGWIERKEPPARRGQSGCPARNAGEIKGIDAASADRPTPPNLATTTLTFAFR